MKMYVADALQKLWSGTSVVQSGEAVECFENEIVGFQIAVENEGVPMRGCRLVVETALPVGVRRVGYVPGEFTDYPDSDDYVIAKGLHVFPDPLLPVDCGAADIKGNSLNAFYCTVGTGERMPCGEHAVRVALYDGEGKALCEAAVRVTVLAGVLPETDLAVTDWMHYDCIANYYGVKPFGAKFMRLTQTFIETAVRHGLNTLYVPLFTPPLDTAVGGERTTAQLIGVEKGADGYAFDFAALTSFLAMAERCGVKYFEFSHLFTQWGAQACPKIIATENGVKKRIFGWDTPADGAEYTNFLEAFLPALGTFLRERGLRERSFIHISDEPSEYWLNDYTARRSLVKRLLPDFTHIDALSEIAFLDRGLVDVPVACTDAAKPFVESGKDFWVYYCFPQCKDNLSNRMMNMPSERTRVLGMQLYLNGAKGFLHWGYNFYNTALSIRSVDPFFETDAGGYFQSGDSFIVYPGRDGAMSSLRLEAFSAGLQDYRALKLLEGYIGRENVKAFLRGYGFDGFTQYPHGSEKFMAVRKAVNGKIAECAARGNREK